MSRLPVHSASLVAPHPLPLPPATAILRTMDCPALGAPAALTAAVAVWLALTSAEAMALGRAAATRATTFPAGLAQVVVAAAAIAEAALTPTSIALSSTSITEQIS